MRRDSVLLGGALARPSPAALALIAAMLAVAPLVVSRIDGDRDLDPFFVVLVAASLLVAALVAHPPIRLAARRASQAVAMTWIVAAAWAAALLVMYQTACGCSSIDPASLPPGTVDAGRVATVFHVLATFGGGALVAAAAFGKPTRANPRRT